METKTNTLVRKSLTHIKSQISQIQDHSLREWLGKVFAVLQESIQDKGVVMEQFQKYFGCNETSEFSNLADLEEYEDSYECRLNKFMTSVQIRAKKFYR